MKRIVLIFIFIICFTVFSINFGNMTIYEYRDSVFYPNGSQTVNISKLYVDIENPDIFSIYIFYRNTTTYIPNTRPITISLKPKTFNISININANKTNNDKWVIYYKITNNYPYDILFNVSFPDGFNIKNISVLVPSNSYKIITLSKIDSSSTLSFKEHNISFTIPTKIRIRYSVPIPFSITKSYDGSKWDANYTIKNDKNIRLNVNVSYWAKIDNNKTYLGNDSIILNPNETFSKSFSIISNSVPTFYMKFYAYTDTYLNITIKPAINVGKSYIIGRAKVCGINFTSEYNPPISPKKHPINEIIRKNNPKKQKTQKSTKNEINNKKQTNSKVKHRTKENNNIRQNSEKHENKKHKSEERKYPTIFGEIGEEKIKKVLASSTSALTATTAFTAIVIPLIYLRRFDIVDKGVFTAKELEELYDIVYIPEGCELGNILPGGLHIVKLNDAEKEIVRDLYEIYDIPLNSAKAIVLGIKYGGRVFLSDEKSLKIALEIGLEAYKL